MCVGIPGQIVGVCSAEQQLANVSVSGLERSVNVACVLEQDEQVQDLLGAWVLVHVGFAMSRIDQQEAAETLQLLRELGEEFQSGDFGDSAEHKLGKMR